MAKRSPLALLWTGLLVHCSSVSDLGPADIEPGPNIGEARQSLTAEQVVGRAAEWVAATHQTPSGGTAPGLLYCQAVYNGWDPVCDYRCNRQSNSAWNAYRSDCSG